MSQSSNNSSPTNLKQAIERATEYIAKTSQALTQGVGATLEAARQYHALPANTMRKGFELVAAVDKVKASFQEQAAQQSKRMQAAEAVKLNKNSGRSR